MPPQSSKETLPPQDNAPWAVRGADAGGCGAALLRARSGPSVSRGGAANSLVSARGTARRSLFCFKAGAIELQREASGLPDFHIFRNGETRSQRRSPC